MTQTYVCFLDFEPSAQIQKLFAQGVDQFLDFVPDQSQVKVLIKKLESELKFQGYVLLNTTWGDFRINVKDATPEDLLETIASKIKSMVSSKRRDLANPDYSLNQKLDTESAVRAIEEFEFSLSSGG